MHRVFTFVHLRSHSFYQLVLTKKVDHGRGIVNDTCGIFRGWEDTDASLDAQRGEKDLSCKRPAWVIIKLTAGKGKRTMAKVQPFQEQNVWVPSCRGPAVSGAYTVTQWPIMVLIAACMTVRRVQGVGFERVALWIPLRGFFAQGQGYTAVSRAQSLKGLFLVVPDTVVRNREEAKTFLKDAFQPPIDAIKALDDMRARAPATVEVRHGWENSRVCHVVEFQLALLESCTLDWSMDNYCTTTEHVRA